MSRSRSKKKQIVERSSLSNRIEVVANLRPHQRAVYDQMLRFNVLLAHRRFGKTVLAILILLEKALACEEPRPQVHYYCPSYKQAKRVAWAYVKEFTKLFPGTQTNELELKATLADGQVIQLGSADNPDDSRGIYSDFVVLDEPAQMPPRMWTEVLRPALSDRKGGMLAIGTPAGRHGLFYDLYNQSLSTENWWSGIYKASETRVVDDEELRSARLAMSKAEYDQEYECSWDSAVKGAYWAEAMQNLEIAGKITKILPTYGKQTHIALDLGINDATAAWFFQADGEQCRLIDYAEYTNMGLPDIVSDWKLRGYNYGKVIAPHDVRNRSLSTGISRQQTLSDLGCDVVVAPKVGVIEGIDITRGFLSKCMFDRDKCQDGIESLRQYKADWQDKRGVLALKPLHDWTSHGADAMRYLATTGLDRLEDRWGTIDYSSIDKGMLYA